MPWNQNTRDRDPQDRRRCHQAARHRARRLIGLGLLSGQVFLCLLPAQIELPKPLSGIYRVDPKGTGADVFRSLAQAVRYLCLAGMSDQVEIVVAPGVYKGVLRFFPAHGQQSGQRIVLRSKQPGAVRLEGTSSTLQFLDGAHDVLIDGFVFGESGSAPAVYIGDRCQDVEIRNCHFTAVAGGQKMVEIQGQRRARRFDIHHNRFELNRQHGYGIYTQGTTQLLVHHNDFKCQDTGEPISIWNSNKSQSKVYSNVFRGTIRGSCLRLNVSGHDVDVYDNLFLLTFGGRRSAVIASRGVANLAWNRIYHNLFVVRGDGMVFDSRGAIAIDHNTYAVESGIIGRIDRQESEDFDSWRDSLAAVAVDEQADAGSRMASEEFFAQHARLLAMFEDPPAKPADDSSAETTRAVDQTRAEVRFLIDQLRVDDVAVCQLALRQLRRLGRRAAAAVAAIGRLCDHAHAPVRADAAAALGAIRIGAEILVPELLEMLKEDNPRVLRPVIDTLGQFAHLARRAEPVLRQLAKHDDEEIQQAAAAALRAVTGQ